MLWSLVYVVVRRLLEFAVLLARGERSKELEILVPHRALGLRAPDSAEIPPPNVRPDLALANLKRRDLLGGLLHEYRAAA